MRICHCTLPHMYGPDACKGCPNLQEPGIVDETYNPYRFKDDKVEFDVKYDYERWMKEIGSKLVKEEENIDGEGI